MRCVEYGQALGRLRSLLSDVRYGAGRLVLVSGGLAGGKTSLLHEFSRYAVDEGVVSLSAVGSAAESGLQLAVIEQLLCGADLPGDVEGRLLGMLTEAAATVGSCEYVVGEDGYSDPRVVRVAREVCGALLNLSRDRPVVIGIDDIQFVDRMSLQMLLYLWRRLSSAHVMLVMSEWEWPQPNLPPFHAELCRQPHHRLRLGPMGERSIAEYASRFMHAETANRIAAPVRRLSAGNPLLVSALVEEFQATGSDEFAASGSHFGEAVVACLHRWGNQVLDVARGLAVLGVRATPEHVARLVEVDGDTVAQVLDIMSASGFVDGCALRHAVARKAVLASLSTARQTRLHIDAAILLHEAGAGALAVAGHLIAAGAAPADWAVEVLREAADRALATDDAEHAVRCLELALDGCVDTARRAVITAATVRAAWRVRPSLAAGYRESLHVAVLGGGLPDSDAITALRQSLWHGDTSAAVAALDMLRRPERDVDTPFAVRARLAYQWVRGAPRDSDSDTGQTRAANSLGTMWTHGVGDATVVNAERVLRTSALGDTTVETIGTALLALANGNQVDKAATSCDRLLDEATRRGAKVWQAVLSDVRARIALLRGELPEAARLAASALELVTPPDWGVCVGWPLGTLALAGTALGRHDVVARAFRAVTPGAMAGTLPGVWYLRARGHHHLAHDRVLAALGDFQDCGKHVVRCGVDVPALLPWRGDLAEVNLRLGRRSEARELVEEQIDRLSPTDVRLRGISLRLLAACGKPAKRAPLLRQAVDMLEVTGDRLELSRALADLSKAHHDLGEADRARAAADRAEVEGRAWRGEVGAAPEPVPASGTSVVRRAKPAGRLSGAEIRVVRLAGLGHTNLEIGRRLNLTVSTVEQHLTRVYRKLGVSSRGELSAVLVQHKANGLEVAGAGTGPERRPALEGRPLDRAKAAG